MFCNTGTIAIRDLFYAKVEDIRLLSISEMDP